MITTEGTTMKRAICAKRTARFMCTLDAGHKGPHGRQYRRQQYVHLFAWCGYFDQAYRAKAALKTEGTTMQECKCGLNYWPGCAWICGLVRAMGLSGYITA